MTFKEKTLSELEDRYLKMMDASTSTPYQNDPSLSSTNTIETKFVTFRKRLSNEQSSYNDTLSKIQSKRQRRIKYEEEKRQARNARNKEIIITLAILFPAFLLLIWAYIMLQFPMKAFSYLHFGWVIAIYIVAFIICILLSIFCFKEHKHRKVLLFLGSIAFLTMMIVGMVCTDNNQIEIVSLSDFDTISKLPSASKRNYLLVSDIDFEGKDCEKWEIIKDFNGTFDGNYHSLKNLVIEESDYHTGDNSYGLFRQNQGTIKNLSIINSKINISKNSGILMVGTICGVNNGLINNCQVVDTSINADCGDDDVHQDCDLYLGGICGINNGIIDTCQFINCNEDCPIYCEGDAGISAGGICGKSCSEIVNSMFYGAKIQYKYTNTLSIRYYSLRIYVGGIVGEKECKIVKSVSVSTLEFFDNSGEKTIYENEETLVQLIQEQLLWTKHDFNFSTPCTGFSKD